MHTKHKYAKLIMKIALCIVCSK